MEYVIASVDTIFDFENHMRPVWGDPTANSFGSVLAGRKAEESLENENICKYYLKGNCHRGSACPYRHTSSRGDKAVVCKHWLRGLCKKGDLCEFLHEYNLLKMPECYFYTNYGECSNGDECQYRHIDPKSRIKECPWFARGFCKHGPTCRHKHVKKIACKPYLFGFCPEGPLCKFEHPKFDVPLGTQDPPPRNTSGQPAAIATFTASTNAVAPQSRPTGSSTAISGGITGGAGGGGGGQRIPMDKITCYRCWQQGHIAHNCPNPPMPRPSNVQQPQRRYPPPQQIPISVSTSQ